MILALDTSQTSGSIALEKDGDLVYSAFFDLSITHSETLMPQIDYALSFCGLRKTELSAIVLSIGPGSFTGLRIGLSTAKGIAFGLQIPVHTFNSLEMTAFSAYAGDRPIVSIIDAKMKEVYAAIYDPLLNDLEPPRVCLPQDLAPLIPAGSILLGSGSHLLGPLLAEHGIHTKGLLKYQNLPSAVNLLGLLQLRPQKDVYNFESLAELEPLYLRESTAQIKRKEMETQKC